jgi:DNA-binding response OmpR family regulator
MAADGRRVLIADSDPPLRQRLFSALLELDIYSDCVSTTTDAIAKLGVEAYGVIVMDVALPFGDADQIVSHIAALPASLRPVVLVLAANPEAARSLDVEIVQIVLRRPVNFPQLVDLVRSCIRNSAARPSIAAPEKESGPGPQVTPR